MKKLLIALALGLMLTMTTSAQAGWPGIWPSRGLLGRSSCYCGPLNSYVSPTHRHSYSYSPRLVYGGARFAPPTASGNRYYSKLPHDGYARPVGRITERRLWSPSRNEYVHVLVVE
jgi:hypothetical protein